MAKRIPDEIYLGFQIVPRKIGSKVVWWDASFRDVRTGEGTKTALYHSKDEAVAEAKRLIRRRRKKERADE